MAGSFETIDLLLDKCSLSSQLLYKFLYNNLRVGQWELARACIEALLQNDGSYEEKFADLLRNVIDEPLLYSDGSHSVETPFHLSWLASLEFLKHFRGKIELPKTLQLKLEFRLLLQSCNVEHVPLEILQELDYYHSELLGDSRSGITTIVPDVSMSWVDHLKTLISKQPRHAHAIIHSLIVPDARYANNNLFFYNLYLDLLKDKLNEMTSLENSLKEATTPGELNKTAKAMLKKHSLSCQNVHQLLSSMDVHLLIDHPEIDEVLMNLLYKAQSNPTGNFTKGSLYSSMLCHPSPYLFRRFCDFETEYQLGNSFRSFSEVSSAPRFFVPSESLLTRTCEKNRPTAWKLLYLYAKQDHHILEDVVNTCVEFAQQGDLDKVIQILSCDEFSPLKVLVLLLAWPHCHTCDRAQKLLDGLWDRERSSEHVLLNQACTKLEYQLHLVKWCLDKATPLLAADESSSEEHQKVYEMFQSLDSHSVLHVLHQSTNLSQLPESEVLEILQTRPVFSCENSSGSQAEIAADTNVETGEAEIQRDIALYHGFCSMRGFLEAIMPGQAENECTDATAKIRESCDHVSSIYPITFRVEILENIFSLLFVSSEHLLEEISAAYETDDLETIDSRSLRSSRTGSFESFVSVDSPWRPSRNLEQSASRPMSPEPAGRLDGERLKQSPFMDAGSRGTKDSEDTRRLDLSKVETTLPEGEARRSACARELNFDDGNVAQDEFSELFPQNLKGSKEKLLDVSERHARGLLVNRTLLCQFLEILRECLDEVIRLKSVPEELDKVYADWMKTSVSMATLDQRISRLSQYINEAQWRYQLVSTCCDVDDLEDDVMDDQTGFFSDDSDLDLEVGKDEDEKRDGNVSKPSKRRKKDLDEGEATKPSAVATSLEVSIPRLLSSPSSLVYMCMKKDSYAQAKNIIKLFNVEEEDSSKAVHFAEEYEKSFQKLTQIEKSKKKEKSSTKTPEKKGRLSALKNVASVAAVGIAATSTTSIVEELLLCASTDLASSGFTLTAPAHAHFLHALVCFDFLCTGQITKHSCKNYLKMARSKMDIAMDIEPLTPYTLQRIAETLSNFESLLDEVDAPTALCKRFGDIKPLNAKSVKNDKDLQILQDNAFAKLELAIDDGDTVIKDISELSPELPAYLKFKQMDQKTAVRVAMADFHHACDCQRDGRLLVVGRERWLVKHRLDYIKSLYNHVNMLSKWELFWNLSSKERSNIQVSRKPIGLQATNPFVVLTHGFDDIAGKPLFERNVPPKKMESMCKKMNVNLIRIIVHNCCPVVPAFGPVRRQERLLLSSSKVVLNASPDTEIANVDDPVQFSEMLVTKIKELLQVMKDSESDVVDVQSLLVLFTSPTYVLLLKEVHKLSYVDLNAIASDEEKICFFTNVLNMLLSQAAITEVAVCASRKDARSRDLGPADYSFNDKYWEKSLPRLDFSYCRTSYLKKYGYNIGQLGFVSAFDLWFTILRTGLPVPATAQNASSSSQVSYRYERYQPRSSDFRLTFAIWDGTISSPEMQALNPENIQSELDNAISDYLSRNVEVIEDDKIYLPELLKWYKNDFMSTLSDRSGELDPNSFGEDENWVELMLQISPYLRGAQFQKFDDLATQLNIEFTPHCWKFGFQFSTMEATTQGETSYKPSTPIMPKYTLTSALSNYLSERSPLVATLVNLSCSQDSNQPAKESRKGEDLPLLTTSLVSPGTQSLEVTSPFEFAMGQAVKFPVLQRHITSAFFSVSKFLYLDGQTKSLQSTSVSAKFAARNQSRLFLLDERSSDVAEMFLRAVNYAWRKADWELLLEIFNSSCINQYGALRGPDDFVLEKAFGSALEPSPDDDIAAQTASTLRNFNITAPNFDLNWKKEKWLLLFRIKDDCVRAEIVMRCLHNWSDVTVGLTLLQFCLSKPPTDQQLLDCLRKKTKQLNLCKKIKHCQPSYESDRVNVNHESWKDVVDQSVRNPEIVLQALQDRERFDLVQEWIDVYGYPSNLREKIHEDYLKFLLTKTPIDVTEVYMYLEKIQDPEKTLEICERLLAKQLPTPNTVFITHFMISDLGALVNPDRKRELLRQQLGAKAALCIPECNRIPYEALTSQPLLLLEQLLIDMKVEWAGKVFEDLQAEMKTNGNYDELFREEISVEAFDKLLVVYATKALKFNVVTYEQEDMDTRHIKTSTPIKGHRRNTSIGATRSLRSEKQHPGTFKIPEKIPAEEDWEPDYKHSVCMICKEVTFNMFVRRHHCRRCGRVVCDACSPFKRVLSNSGRTPVRICKDCDRAMFEQSFRQKEAEKVSRTGSLPTNISKSFEGRASAEFRERLDSAVLKLDDEFNFDGNQEGARLSLNEESNEEIRENFLYEQAPSSSLCTSILALHGDSKTCAELLLDLCNKLSQKLGMSEEIDNNLLISIICQLLYHAKLKFTNCGETHGVELCDTYMSRVELVKFLIESNFYEVPSIEDLMSSQSARRLRDKLIENESLSLAMEVTTKCGLDPGAVWGAWGLAYLQVGQFKEARKKFNKFLKPSERGKTTQGNQRYLKMIIDILETSPMLSFDYLIVGDLAASLASLREHAKNTNGTRIMDQKRFEECIFYLNMYGSYSGVVTFYVNHNYLKLACRFILEKRCAPDIFTEHLLMPAIRHGQFDQLRDLLKMFDPSLEVWMPHLNGACRYLNRSNLLNVLYRVQLLMKDYFRAAMTCIKFYQGLPHHVATNYTDLHSRLNYLQDALSHLQAVRKHQQSKKGTLAMVSSSLQKSLGESNEDKSRLAITPTELTNYMNTITLQIDVTKFMYNCLVEGTFRRNKGKSEKIGTLFDNANVKCNVVSMVLLAGNTVDDGFSLSCRIIQDFRMPTFHVYKIVAEKLASEQKFSEIQLLLSNAMQTRLMNDKDHDSVVITLLGMLTDDDRKWKQAEALIKSLKDEGKKVAAYIRFRRLKTAYLIAVASDRVDDVRTIGNMAKETEQTKVYNICMKWLETRQVRREKQDVFPAQKD
ncbi:zinc finger FYVE domain-containing protein 26-like isoform X2 [Dendronephthya gigantea]|uniref:zinc finger FYVE domain-containing protein 26-like isoform X2 n=1 Tax=Dendronephthya gigantea TaxID=151771 RepID=UPI00106A5CFB|nr:zinc finger FYVE domain-containing protein 26-like isoform X2 [Dendronephthya gigantea]